jgi:hypothetical protein
MGATVSTSFRVQRRPAQTIDNERPNVIIPLGRFVLSSRNVRWHFARARRPRRFATPVAAQPCVRARCMARASRASPRRPHPWALAARLRPRFRATRAGHAPAWWRIKVRQDDQLRRLGAQSDRRLRHSWQASAIKKLRCRLHRERFVPTTQDLLQHGHRLLRESARPPQRLLESLLLPNVGGATRRGTRPVSVLPIRPQLGLRGPLATTTSTHQQTLQTARTPSSRGLASCG